MVIQERITDSDMAKVDANAKTDAPDASDASEASKIKTTNINVYKWMGKLCSVEIKMYWHVYLRQQSLYDTQSDGEGAYIKKFNAKKEGKNRQQKPTRNENQIRYRYVDVYNLYIKPTTKRLIQM